VLSNEEAEALLARSEADYAEVVRPYLIGKDISEHPLQAPRRFVIDFDRRTLEEAVLFPAALDILRDRVRGERAANRDRYAREHWWRHGRPVLSMRQAISPLPRYLGGTATGKRIFFCWCEPWTCPSNAMNVFAFAEDYALGVLSAHAHQEWARAQSSTMRVDPRYTPTSAFETFPWPPVPTHSQQAEIGKAAVAMIDRRQAICAEREIGLTALYNEVDEGAYADLAALHGRLDRAVAAAYGWPAAVATDAGESNRRLLELNGAVARGDVRYAPFDSGGSGP
jgi:hypothetical protein